MNTEKQTDRPTAGEIAEKVLEEFMKFGLFIQILGLVILLIYGLITKITG